MHDHPINVVGEFPRRVKEIENTFIALTDGTQLAARIWLPEDADDHPVPAILEYLPYRKRDGTSERDALTHPYYAGHGYACVRVDMRGAGESSGLLHDEYLKSEQDDALEVLQWIVDQPWCSGNTGMIGISWGGFNGLQVAARQPSSLKAIVTICSTDDRYADDIHYMGGVMLEDNLTWGSTMFAYQGRPPDPAIVGDRWRELWLDRLKHNDPWILNWLEHQTRDAHWQHGSICENYDAVECAVYAVGGWADGYSNAVPRLLANLNAPCKGLIGPWAHKYPHFALPGPRIGFLQETLRWWDHWLKEKDTGVMDEPQYRVWMQEPAEPHTQYVTRDGRWIAEAAWPSPAITELSLNLTTQGLTHAVNETSTQTIQTPLSLGARQGCWFGFGLRADGPADQREDDGCSLIFETAPLAEDIEILGAPVVTLKVSADEADAFVVARLNDVAPNGASTRVTFGVLNLAHRNSHEHPEPLTPGETYDIRVQLKDAAQRFVKGHRIRLSLSNTMWPMFWPSPKVVSLTLQGEGSHLTLPVRTPSSSDTALPPFAPAESAPPQLSEQLEPAQFSRQTGRDDTNGDSFVTVIDDSGLIALNQIGWYHSTVSRHYFSINDKDPNSARAHTHWTTRQVRPDANLDVRVETHTTLTSSETEFHVDAKLEAFEGETLVYGYTWNKSFQRNHN